MSRSIPAAMASAALALAVSAAPAVADDWPTGPLTMVIGFEPGGSTDIQGRALANVLEEHFGQPVNVVNRPGAASAVALTQLMNTEDDGHTFLFGPLIGLTFSPIVSDLEYDIDDFRYPGFVAMGQAAIVTSSEQPFSTLEELIEHGQDNPLTYAQQSPIDQQIIINLAEETGLDLAIVPTGGGGGMAPLVLGQEVDFAFSGGTHAQYTPTGEMEILAFLTAERSPFYPDVPTLIELGYDMSFEDYRTLVLPGNVSDEIVSRYEEAARYATEQESFREVTEDSTFQPVMFHDSAASEELLRSIRTANEALLGDHE